MSKFLFVFHTVITVVAIVAVIIMWWKISDIEDQLLWMQQGQRDEINLAKENVLDEVKIKIGELKSRVGHSIGRISSRVSDVSDELTMCQFELDEIDDTKSKLSDCESKLSDCENDISEIKLKILESSAQSYEFERLRNSVKNLAKFIYGKYPCDSPLYTPSSSWSDRPLKDVLRGY